MRTLTFEPEPYTYKCVNEANFKAGVDSEKKYGWVYDGDGVIGILELFWTVFAASNKQLTKKEAKICKRLRATLKTISRFKDEDEDSRILIEGGPHTVVLEEDEWDLAKELVNETKFKAVVSDEYDTLCDLLDNAKEFKKPELVKDIPSEYTPT